MQSLAARSAFRAAPRLRAAVPTKRFSSGMASIEDKKASADAVKKGARRDPELYILFAIMSGVFGLAGWHFSRKPTSSSSERAVSKVPNSEPWKEDGSTTGKYKYAPNADPSAPKKDAPSALNTVIIPNVTLPKELHDKYNKWGKEGY